MDNQRFFELFYFLSSKTHCISVFQHSFSTHVCDYITEISITYGSFNSYLTFPNQFSEIHIFSKSFWNGCSVSDSKLSGDIKMSKTDMTSSFMGLTG